MARKGLLIALDSIGIDPLGVNRSESVYSRSQFLFPRNQTGPVQLLDGPPCAGLLVETDVTNGLEIGGIECALTYTSIFTGESAVRSHGLTHSLEMNSSLLESAVERSNLFSLFQAPCLANALFPAHLPFFRSSYVEDVLPSCSRQQVEGGLQFRGRLVRLTGAGKHGFAELFTLAEINQNIFVHAARKAGMRLRNYDDVRRGQALTSTMTNQLESEFNLSFFGEPALPILTPEAAAQVLGDLLEAHDFVFYKYQMADLVSHTGQLHLARETLTIIERFLQAILDRVDQKNTIVVVTSDHGHLEQVGFSRGHPKTKVPTWCFGALPDQAAAMLSKPEGIFACFASIAL